MPAYDVQAKLREQRSQTDGVQAVYESVERQEAKQEEHKRSLERDIERIVGTTEYRRGLDIVEPNYVLTEKEVIPETKESLMPTALAIYDTVPTEFSRPVERLKLIAQGTAQPSVGFELMGNSLKTASAAYGVIGSIVVMAGKQVLASIATSEIEAWSGRQSFNVMGRNIRVRVHTGKGPGKGRYLRLRGEGGQLPNDEAEPFDSPSRWWYFWDYFGS